MLNDLRQFYSQGKWSSIIILLFPLLVIFSFIFFFIVIIRRCFYSWGVLASYRPVARVVSVGNITFGGSGKTPMVVFLSRFYSAQGRRPAVILRGYKKPGRQAGTGLSSGEEDFYELGDEGRLLKETLNGSARVVSGINRAFLARRLDAEKKCDVFVLDDGFQHLALKRDLDIVMVDATRPFGNGWILPAGPLREPPGALRRANIFCVSRVNEVDAASLNEVKCRLAEINPGALIIESVHKPVGLYELATGKERALNDLIHKPVGIFCGIGNPSSFEKSVMGAGAVIVKRRFFDDHHVYSSEDLAGLFGDGAAAGIQTWVTTQKDAMRIKDIQKGGTLVLVLKVSLDVTKGFEELRGRLLSL
jgi:tetraacyldisaccharide 4'-kinase